MAQKKDRRVPTEQRRSSRWTVGAAASGLALATGLASSRPALAREWRASGDVGAFLAVHVGARWQLQWGVGIEARGVFIDRGPDCDETPQLVFAGAVARAELVQLKQVRLTLGPVGGSTDGILGFSADATGGVALGPAGERAWVGHLNVDGTAAVFPNVRLGYSFINRQSEGAVAIGARVPPLVEHKTCVVGRPVRRDDRRAPVAGARALVSTLPRRDRQSDARAGSAWMQRACMEWASVPAFCELAEQLVVCGAPAELVGRARDAAADELRHAVMSAELAAVLSRAASVDLDPPVTNTRTTVPGREGLLRLAVESWQDGCVGEGTAAALAAREAVASGPARIGRTQRRIAADEQRHANLAWEVIEWVLRTDPAAARPLLEQAASGVLAARPVGTSTPGPAANDTVVGLSEYGILDADRVAPILAEVEAESRARLAARLAAS